MSAKTHQLIPDRALESEQNEERHDHRGQSQPNAHDGNRVDRSGKGILISFIYSF